MDPIADMFSKIKNAYAVKKESVFVPHSKFKMEIAKLLQKNGYVKEIGRRGKKSKKSLEIVLLYHDDQPALEEIRRISKPSCRVYKSHKEIFSRGRHRLSILSTPGGVLSGAEARKQKLGGELIAEVW